MKTQLLFSPVLRSWLIGLFTITVAVDPSLAISTNSAELRCAAEPEASGKPGLLIIAHGAPGKAWNQPVIELAE